MRGRYDVPPPEDAAAAAGRPAPEPDGPLVLVVDDEPSNLRLAQAYLHAEGLRTCTASAGAEALARLDAGGVDLVLLDIRMPHMDGFEVCRRIRRDPRHRRVPVIFLTAELNDPESELQGLEVGADEYLHKPIQRRQLVARVKNLIRLADAERDRRLLAQLAQAEKFAAIGQIAAGVAHEINNPLAFMLSNLGTLRDYLADARSVLAAYRQSPEEGRALEARLKLDASLQDADALLAETAEGGQRVRAIVQELKTFSRAEDGQLEPLDLAEVAAATLVLTERELSARARVVKQLQPARVARAPRGRLHQMVLNLLVNALQSLDKPGGTHQHEIRIFTRTEAGAAVLGVSDTGCGIPKENLERIFDPFFTTKPVGVGTGIGLSVCAMVAERMGGRINVESEVGRGTTFTLRVPQQPAAAADEA